MVVAVGVEAVAFGADADFGTAQSAEQDAADQVDEAVLFVAGQFAFGVVVPAHQGDDGDVGDGKNVVGQVQRIPVSDADVASDSDQAF